MMSALRIALCPILFISSANAAETYDLEALMLKSRVQEKGETYQTIINEVESQQIEGVPGQERSVESRKRKEKTTEVLAVNKDGRPTKVKVTYQSWGEMGPDGPVHAVDGVQILIEEQEGTSTYSHIGGPSIPPDLAQSLDAQMNSRGEKDWASDIAGMQAMLPDDPLAIGDSWPLDMKAIAATDDFPPEIPIVNGTGNGTLLSKQLIDGREYLQIKIDFSIPIVDLGGVQCRSDCTMQMSLELHPPVDGIHGDMKMTTSMSLKGEFERNGEVMRMSMEGQEEKTQKRLK